MSEAICSKCNGSGRAPYQGDPTYRHITASYDAASDTFACDNCGGQTMSGRATGMTRIDPATGLGCLHTFVERQAGNCYHIYTCSKLCGTFYDIDSGD